MEFAGVRLNDETNKVLSKIMPDEAPTNAISVVAVAPGPFQDAVVPVTAVKPPPYTVQANDLEMASMALSAMPIKPRDDIATTTFARKPPKERQRKLKSKEELAGEQGPERVVSYGDENVYGWYYIFRYNFTKVLLIF